MLPSVQKTLTNFLAIMVHRSYSITGYVFKPLNFSEIVVFVIIVYGIGGTICISVDCMLLMIVS